MPSLFIILFNVNIVLAVFVLAYYIVLRRLTFHTLNRFFLLTGIAFSSLCPFMNLSFLLSKPEQIPFISAAPEIGYQFQTLVSENADPVYYSWLFTAFYAGLAFMFIRLIRQFVSLYRIHRSSDLAFVGKLRVRLVGAEVSPFSFGSNIYINPSLIKKETLQTIIAHEHVHVRQWHTIDILLAELVLSICWFNPAAWLVRKAIKENLEFVADRQVLQTGTDKRNYQRSLVNLGILTTGLQITNDFNLVDLKKRIRMMNSKRSSRIMLVRYALLIPVVLFVSLAFTMSPKKAGGIVSGNNPILNTTKQPGPNENKSRNEINNAYNTASSIPGSQNPGSKTPIAEENPKKRASSQNVRRDNSSAQPNIAPANDAREKGPQPRPLRQGVQPSGSVTSTGLNMKVTAGRLPSGNNSAAENEIIVTGYRSASRRVTSPVTGDKANTGSEEKLVPGTKLPNASSEPEPKTVTGYKLPQQTPDLEPRTVIGRQRQRAIDSSATKRGN
jgi:hypothetical protein